MNATMVWNCLYYSINFWRRFCLLLWNFHYHVHWQWYFIWFESNIVSATTLALSNIVCLYAFMSSWSLRNTWNICSFRAEFQFILIVKLKKTMSSIAQKRHIFRKAVADEIFKTWQMRYFYLDKKIHCSKPGPKFKK